jgi:GNAT superfamily N-acetyltransferase
LSSALNKSSAIYILEINNEPIGFCAVIHFPHPRNAKLKKVHRIVIRPDYQGLGVGTKFLEEVGKLYSDFDFRITTTNSALINSLKVKKKWVCTNYSLGTKHNGRLSTTSTNTTSRIMATFKLMN